ncbi:hypothetical protein [uncultured Tateyamaria sp.]|uniref:hypothetical protein n=1 Tax=uncultured Tateyamaria sp. TaxID=455651 RepID=UPI00261EAFFB|nr:hypothetical protein [uncultured Tateyamaria sp.]
MWYLQLLVEHVSLVLADATALNLIFAALALWAGFGKYPRTCAMLVALIHALSGLM